MSAVNPETVRQWAELLNDEARAFSMHTTPARAQNLLVLADCVKAAATGYLIKQKMEDVINGQK